MHLWFYHHLEEGGGGGGRRCRREAQESFAEGLTLNGQAGHRCVESMCWRVVNWDEMRRTADLTRWTKERAVGGGIGFGRLEFPCAQPRHFWEVRPGSFLSLSLPTTTLFRRVTEEVRQVD